MTLLSVSCFVQMNIGGATDRPVPADIWSYVKGRLSGDVKDTDPVPDMQIRGKDSKNMYDK